MTAQRRPLTEVEFWLMEYISVFQPCPLPTPQQINVFVAASKSNSLSDLNVLLDEMVNIEEYKMAAYIKRNIESLSSEKDKPCQ